MNENLLKAREQRKKEENKTKILKLIAILLLLIALIPIQTIIWLLRNPPEQPKWFSAREQVEIEFELIGE